MGAVDAGAQLNKSMALRGTDGVFRVDSSRGCTLAVGICLRGLCVVCAPLQRASASAAYHALQLRHLSHGCIFIHFRCQHHGSVPKPIAHRSVIVAVSTSLAAILFYLRLAAVAGY